MMRPTQVRLLVALFALGAAIGWALGTVTFTQVGRILPVPLLAPMTVWVIAAGLAIWTMLSRPRLLRRPGHRPLPALLAARTAALALAASRAGALVGGFYLGLGVATVGQLATPSGSATVWGALATSAACVVLIAIALWLERLCRIPNRDDDPSAPSPA